MALTELIIENIGVFAAAGGGVLGAVMAAIWVVRYRLPALEKRTISHEQRLTDLEAAQNDGQFRYVHVENCRRLRSDCGHNNESDLLAIRNDLNGMARRLDEMERARNEARTLQLQFMSAVKEKLDLKFTVPVN